MHKFYYVPISESYIDDLKQNKFICEEKKIIKSYPLKIKNDLTHKDQDKKKKE